jgi:hypothetical protein
VSRYIKAGPQAMVAEGVSIGDVGSCTWRCVDQKVLPKWPWPEDSRFGCMSGYQLAVVLDAEQRKRARALLGVNGECAQKQFDRADIV